MSPRPDHIACRAGFTLVEATLAIAITTILVVGMGAALVASASAADMGKGASSLSLSTAQAMDLMRAELGVAKAFQKRSGTGVTFTIADRNGDGVDEQIAYSWSGKPGSPLYRNYNQTGEAPIIDACDRVDFAFLVQPSPTLTDALPQTLMSYSGDMSASANAVSISGRSAGAQYWRPTASGSRVYRVTSVKLALAAGTGASTTLRLRALAMDGTQPTGGTLLGTATIMSGSFPRTSGYSMVTFQFPTPVVLEPNVGAWFVLDAPGATVTAAGAAYDLGKSSQPSNSALVVTSDCGATWTNVPDGDLTIVIEGNESTVSYPAEEMQ